MALRGDPPRRQEKWKTTVGGFTCAWVLEKQRKSQGDYFSQCQVYGVFEREGRCRRQFVITQMVLGPHVCVGFLVACKVYGIHVPIVPGIMCLKTFGGFKCMTNPCKRARLRAARSRRGQSCTSKAVQRHHLPVG